MSNSPIKASFLSADAAVPMKHTLHSVAAWKLPQVFLPQSCVAAASALECWLGLGCKSDLYIAFCLYQGSANSPVMALGLHIYREDGAS